MFFVCSPNSKEVGFFIDLNLWSFQGSLKGLKKIGAGRRFLGFSNPTFAI